MSNYSSINLTPSPSDRKIYVPFIRKLGAFTFIDPLSPPSVWMSYLVAPYLGARRTLPSPKLVSDSESLVVVFNAIISAEWHLRFLRLLSTGAAFEVAAAANAASFLSVDDDDVVMAPSLTFAADRS